MYLLMFPSTNAGFLSCISIRMWSEYIPGKAKTARTSENIRQSHSSIELSPVRFIPLASSRLVKLRSSNIQ